MFAIPGDGGFQQHWVRWYFVPAFSAFLLCAVVLIGRRVQRTYRFGGGFVSCVNKSGRELWRESLAGLQSVTMSSDSRRGWTLVKLTWQDHVRAFELSGSMEKALRSPHA